MESSVEKLIPETQIGPDVAKAQWDNVLEYYDFKLDDIENENLVQSIESSEKKIIRAIQNGQLEVKEEDGVPIMYQNLKKEVKGINSPIRYKEVSGKAKIAMRSSKENDHYGKLYGFMGGLCGLGANSMACLRGRDMSLMECLGTVFLQV